MRKFNLDKLSEALKEVCDAFHEANEEMEQSFITTIQESADYYFVIQDIEQKYLRRYDLEAKDLIFTNDIEEALRFKDKYSALKVSSKILESKVICIRLSAKYQNIGEVK